MAKRTPPIGARGIYQLRYPWVTKPTKVYTCYAIRSFEDIYEVGVDVYTTYYVPLDLDSQAFDKDRDEKANIITLISEDNEIIYVPDTYIEAYPDTTTVNYQHVVVSIDFGALPDYLDLSYIKNELANLCTTVVGKTPNVEEHVAPSTGAITPEEHETLEADRLNNIVYTDTSHAMYLKMLLVNGELIAKNQALSEAVVRMKEELEGQG